MIMFRARRSAPWVDPQMRGPGDLTMTASVPGPSANGLLDDVNKAIVEELQKDGRRTYGSIAEAVGLSEAAVRQRVQKMRDAGIMQIVAVTDPLQVGFRSQAMVGIRADGDCPGGGRTAGRGGRHRLRGDVHRLVRHPGRAGVRGRGHASSSSSTG